LKKEALGSLLPYVVSANNKSYEFWQRDSLAIRLYSREVAMQKLKYIHNNPLAEHWILVTDPSAYKYSSACYYEMDKKKFAFLKDLLQEF
jgi:putative transposase